jgi:Galactose oxidase, central domain
MSVKPILKPLLFIALIMASAVFVGCGGKGCNPSLSNLCTNAAPAGTPSPSPTPGGASSGPFTIGGNVIGLTGTGLVLQDNGGDDLTISQNGAFTFKVPIAGGGNYTVTLKTQPSNQPLPCSVTNGTGKATANVTNVQVTCGNTFTVGGTVSGLQGSGLVLQDNGGDNLTVGGKGNVNFTFGAPLAGGSSYAVTILTQPTNPGQTCSVLNGSGTATGDVTTVQVTCPQTGFTVGGNLVGLVNGPGDTVELMNNGGDNILVTGNNTNFIFPTLVTAGGAYDISIFAQPTSQPQGCAIIGYEGVANFNISNVIIDCQHNDWIWVDGPNTSGQFGTASLPPTAPPSHDTNVPGGRQFAATWSDSTGRKWIYGGWGLDVSGATPPNLPGLLNDLWLYSPSSPTFNGWIPAGLTIKSATSGAVTTHQADLTPIQTTNNGSGSTPGGRWGSISWSDNAGNLYLFGGQCSCGSGATGLMNDLWKFAPGSYDATTPAPPATPTTIGSYTETGTWTNPGAAGAANYGTQGVASASNLPGRRWGAAFATDPSNTTVWVFGGQGLDSAGNLGLLNDLWKYNIAGGTWTWMGPVGSTAGQNNGVYGTQGTAAATNVPGGRQQAKLWVDSVGNVWLFGGLGLDSAGTRNPGALSGLANGTATPDGALLNDLWKYNTATGQWTWVTGGGATGLADQSGVYGTQQVPAAGNVPGARWGSVGFIDPLNNIWLVDGWGYGSTTVKSTGYLNDVWQYIQSTGQWIWWKGSSDVNQAGSFPTDIPPSWGVPYVKNTPGGRFGAASWKQDAFDYFWIFGGEGVDISGSSNRLDDFLAYLPFPQPQ